MVNKWSFIEGMVTVLLRSIHRYFFKEYICYAMQPIITEHFGCYEFIRRILVSAVICISVFYSVFVPRWIQSETLWLLNGIVCVA